MRYTYIRQYAARYSEQIVTIPDQVADNQLYYDGKTFPALRRDGSKVRVRLRGELYALGKSGTGDPVVTSPNAAHDDTI